MMGNVHYKENNVLIVMVCTVTWFSFLANDILQVVVSCGRDAKGGISTRIWWSNRKFKHGFCMNAISVLERFIIVMSVIKCLLYQVIILSNFLLMASWFFIFFLWLHNVSIEKLIWAEYWSHRNNVIMKCSD